MAVHKMLDGEIRRARRDWREVNHMNMDEMRDGVSEFIAKAGDYFSQLSPQEQYGWAGEAVGFVLLVAGLVLLLI